MFRVAFALLLSTAVFVQVSAFSSALFVDSPALKKTAPSIHDGFDVELPDFDELFGRIQQVSPLARQVVQGRDSPDKAGFAYVDDSCKYCTTTHTLVHELVVADFRRHLERRTS